MVVVGHSGGDGGGRYVGIRGWLVLPAIIHPLVGVGYCAIGAFDSFKLFSDALTLDTKVFVVAISLGAVALGVGWLAALYYASTMNPIFPKLYIWLTMLSIVFPIAAILYSGVRYNTKTSPQDYKEIGQSILMACIWIPYMLVSKRVRATFIAPSLTHSADIANPTNLLAPTQAREGGFWYHVKGNQPAGPLTFEKLIDELMKEPDPLKVYVWHTSFRVWQQAQNVKDIANYVAVLSFSGSTEHRAGPPVIPSSVGSVKRFGESKWVRWVTFAVVVIVLTIARQLATSIKSEPTIDPAALISGKTRDSFVKSGLDSCLRKQENDPENKAALLSRETLSSYCSCYIDKLSQSITNGDLQNNQPQAIFASDGMKKKMEVASSVCMRDFQKKMMGG